MASMRTTLLRDHTFRAAHLVALLDALNGYYVIPGQEPAISQRGAGANMSVDVGAFKYVLAGVFGEKLTTTNVAIDASDATNPRIDQLYLSAAGTLTILKGTARAVKPTGESTWQKYEEPYPADFSTTAGILLAEILVPAGATSIVNDYIRNIVAPRLNTLPPNEYTTILKIASGSIYEYDGDGNMLDSGSSSTPADVHDIIEHAIGRGGTCLMLAGTYDIGANEINPPTDGSRWVLEGADRKIVIIKGSGTQVFNFASTSGTYRETGCIRNLTIDGSTGTAHGIVIAAKYCWTEIANRVNIENCVDAIRISDSVDLDFTDVRILTCSYGVKILTGCTAINFVRPYIDTITNQGIYLEGEVSGCKFIDGVVELCGNPAIKFYRTSDGKPSGCVLDSLWIEEDGTNDLILFDGNTGTSGWYGPSGNIIQRCTFHCGSNVNAFVITRGRRNIFSENVCFGSGSTHFTISEGAYSENNLILNCVTTGAGHWVVSDSGTTNVKTNVAEAE